MQPRFPNDKDGAGLIEAVNAGVDLKSPVEFSYYLYFPTEDAAAAVAEEIQDKGFVVEVRSAALGPG